MVVLGFGHAEARKERRREFASKPRAGHGRGGATGEASRGAGRVRAPALAETGVKAAGRARTGRSHGRGVGRAGDHGCGPAKGFCPDLQLVRGADPA